MDDNILANILHRLMSEARLTASELGRHLNLPAATIKKLRTGENKNPTITTLYPIAKHFRINISQLIGEEPLTNNSGHPKLDHNIAYNSDKLTNIVPLINWDETTTWPANNHNNTNMTNNRQQILVEQSVSKQAYALLLDTNYSLFKQGGIIIVEPSDSDTTNPQHINTMDSYVLVHKIGQRLPSLKKILAEDGNLYIQSLIPELNITQRLTSEYTILGNILAYKKWFAATLHQ